jgi:hypothetical protein
LLNLGSKLTDCVSQDQQDTSSGQDGHLVKFPKPSNSPRDPLNFSFRRKAAALVVASLYAFIANYTSSVIAPVLQLWPSVYRNDPRSFSELSYIIAVRTQPLLQSSNMVEEFALDMTNMWASPTRSLS